MDDPKPFSPPERGLEALEAQPLLTANLEPGLAGRIFEGPNGIRAGWRLLIFLVLTALLALALLTLISPLLRKVNFPGVLTGEGAVFLAALAASLVMGRIEKRSLAAYGLPLRGAFGAQFWFGAFWGFAALTALLAAIHLGHGFDFGSMALSGRSLVSYAALWGVTFLAVGFAEEYLFRGYPLATLSTGMGFWPAAILLSALFGAVHIRNAGEDWRGALAAALIGLFFCLTLRRTGSLWFAIGLHAGWDYSESFIYSVPDSGAMIPGHLVNSSFHGPAWLTGGSVGPEGSALVFAVVGGLFLIFSLTHGETRFRPI